MVFGYSADAAWVAHDSSTLQAWSDGLMYKGFNASFRK